MSDSIDKEKLIRILKIQLAQIKMNLPETGYAIDMDSAFDYGAYSGVLSVLNLITEWDNLNTNVIKDVTES